MIRRLIDTALRKLMRSGLRRGLAGEGLAWLALAGAAYLLQRARRPEESKTTVDLQPGERYLVSLIEPGTGRPPADG